MMETRTISDLEIQIFDLITRKEEIKDSAQKSKIESQINILSSRMNRIRSINDQIQITHYQEAAEIERKIYDINVLINSIIEEEFDNKDVHMTDADNQNIEAMDGNQQSDEDDQQHKSAKKRRVARPISMMDAVTDNDLDQVRALLQEGVSINEVGINGATPLFIAAQEGHLEMVEFLLKEGASIDTTTDEGATPLYIAAEGGHLETVDFLLKQGASIDTTTNEGVTPLYIAAENGQDDIVRVLLKQRASVDTTNNEGVTPLFIATQNGHFYVVKLLCKANAQMKAFKSDIKLLWFFASENNVEDNMEDFLRKYCDKNNIDITDTSSTILITPVDIAGIMNHAKIFRYLRSRTRNINYQNDIIIENQNILFNNSQQDTESIKVIEESLAKTIQAREFIFFKLSYNISRDYGHLLKEPGDFLVTVTSNDHKYTILFNDEGKIKHWKKFKERSNKLSKNLSIDDVKTILQDAKKNSQDDAIPKKIKLKQLIYPNLSQQAKSGLLNTESGDLIDIKTCKPGSQILFVRFFNHDLKDPGDFLIQINNGYHLIFKQPNGTITHCRKYDNGKPISKNDLEEILHGRVIKIKDDCYYLQNLIYPKGVQIALPGLIVTEQGKLTKCILKNETLRNILSLLTRGGTHGVWEINSNLIYCSFMSFEQVEKSFSRIGINVENLMNPNNKKLNIVVDTVGLKDNGIVVNIPWFHQMMGNEQISKLLTIIKDMKVSIEERLKMPSNSLHDKLRLDITLQNCNAVLSDIMTVKGSLIKKCEVQKNSSVLAQAMRTKTGFFAILPEEILFDILEWTRDGDNSIFSGEEIKEHYTSSYSIKPDWRFEKADQNAEGYTKGLLWVAKSTVCIDDQTLERYGFAKENWIREERSDYHFVYIYDKPIIALPHANANSNDNAYSGNFSMKRK